MQTGASIIYHLDFINAKAHYADAVGGTMPNLHDSAEMEWYHACHPVLKLSLERHNREIVPIDIRLTKMNAYLSFQVLTPEVNRFVLKLSALCNTCSSVAYFRQSTTTHTSECSRTCLSTSATTSRLRMTCRPTAVTCAA